PAALVADRPPGAGRVVQVPGARGRGGAPARAGSEVGEVEDRPVRERLIGGAPLELRPRARGSGRRRGRECGGDDGENDTAAATHLLAVSAEVCGSRLPRSSEQTRTGAQGRPPALAPRPRRRPPRRPVPPFPPPLHP